MRTIGLVLSVGALLGLTGCESMGTAAQSKTTQGTVLGSLLGAGTGAIIGNQTGHAGAGTAIGAGLGALGGGLMGHALEEQDQKIQQQQFPPATAPAAGSSSSAQAEYGTKFCPVGGETYPNSTYKDPNIKYCPIHGVELKYKQQ